MPVRYPSIALARGLSVLFMPSIHTVMLYSQPSVAETLPGYVIRFVAECISSHLYMFLMGFFLALGHPRPAPVILRRAFGLFVAGYLLNGVRIYLPARMGLIPETFLSHYGACPGHLFPLLLTGDILQFAGIAYGLVAALQKQRYTLPIAFGLYLLISFTAPAIWGIQSSNSVLDHFLNLLAGTGTTAFFPLFPWLCYPLAGLAAGSWLQQHPNRRNHRTALCAGLILLGTGAFISSVSPSGWELDFYRNGPGGTLLHTGMVLLWLVLFHSIPASLIKGRVTSLLLYCNRHITAIYLLHWIIVGWGIGLAGYQSLNPSATYIALLLINGLTIAFLLIYQKFTSASSTF